MSTSYSNKKAKPSPSPSSFNTGAVSHPSHTRISGENGHAQISRAELSDDLLFLFDKSVRGVSFSEVSSLTTSLLTSATTLSDITDIFLLAFQTRWSRGGKGEKLIFYQLLNILYSNLPSATLSVLDLLPHFGYWKDPMLLLKECCNTNKLSDDASLDLLKAKCYTMYATQLEKDHAELLSSKAASPPRNPNLTFVAKFAPSENKEFDKLFNCVGPIACLMYPPDNETKKAKLASIKKYRQTCTALRAGLEVPEVKECCGKFSEINFERVTSLCMNRKMKSFLNEKLRDSKMQNGEYEETGDRFPENEDRVEARKHLLELILKKGSVKGKDLFPHELVENCQKGGYGGLSTGVKAVINAQWIAMRENVIKMAEERKKALERKAEEMAEQPPQKPIDLGKVICMADVSGSMSGTPMSVSIAMGILLSEICHPAFRDLVLTFHDNPIFHDLKGCENFTEKCQSLQRAPWGGSTDFEKAFNLILDVIERQKLKQEDIPDLMVVSDMQFNNTSGYGGYGSYGGGGEGSKAWTSASEKIKGAFADLGVAVSLVPECISGSIIQAMVFVKGQHSNVAVLSLTSNIVTAALISASISIEKDIDKDCRSHTPGFYGMIDLGSDRQKKLVCECIFMIAACQLASKAFAVSLCSLESGTILAAYLSIDMGLLFVN
ncbi:hypothetical protein TL16_g05026 [Triparma laevis f. inornata]|uniref:Uncharacterized protein n=1 Tax=Triparma laevis f. inornata TaxID=1714386 RepID=A0A9W7AA65_9STRA|nr:hypothetical protein TL16_g05026 [Triparma laevis f. inornata]